METNNEKRETNNKKMLLIILGTILIIVALLGLTYAYWTVTKKQTGENVISTACLKIEFTDKDDINLEYSYPMADSDGMDLTPYEFTIKNTCESPIDYQVNLEVLNTATLDSEHMKMSFNGYAPKLINTYTTTATTLDNADEAYKLTKGTLEPSEEKTYNIRQWMDEKTSQAVGENKEYNSKITVIVASYEEPSYLAINKSTDTETSMFLNGLITRDMVESIKFDTDPYPPITSINAWDASEKQDGSITAWYDDINDNGKYEVVIGGEGGVYANPDSSFLFYRFENLETLDLTNFDTSNVKNMYAMFWSAGYANLTFTLDLGDKFDTSKVENMKHMFNSTGMISTVLTLDLGDKFNTSKVTDMYQMFFYTGYNSSAFTLDLGDKFDTSNVTNMEYMFSYTGHNNPNSYIKAKNTTWNPSATKNSMFSDSKATHTFYAKDATAASFVTGAGFAGTVIDCSSVTCP